MATTFPTTLQDFDATRGTATQRLNSPSHVDHHVIEDDTVEALQTKVGIDSSAVTTTLDYKLKNASSIDPGHLHTSAGISGALGVAAGGTGAATHTAGIVKASGTTAFTTVAAPTGAVVGDTDAQTLTNKTLTTPIISSISNTGTVTLPTATDTLVGKATTDTLTNKSITPKVVSATSITTSVAINADTTDIHVVTAQAEAILYSNPTGTLVQGQKLIIRIKDNATARAITWGANFRAMGTALPSTTVLSKTKYLGFIFNSTDTKWDLVAAADEA